VNPESPPGPERSGPGDANQPGQQNQINSQQAITVKLGSAIERLSAIEKYLLELVNDDAIKYALLILAASRCRTAKDAIKSHIEPDPPLRPVREPWWQK
jgi:hypothetical protein